MAKHHGLRLRFNVEIRNGDGNFYEGLKGSGVPKFVNIDPLNIEEGVNEAVRRVLPLTVDRLATLIPDHSAPPHHD